MTHAYNELYLNDAKNQLGNMYDYLINSCGIDGILVSLFFKNTGYAELFQSGNPTVIVGMSGIELGKAVISKAYCGYYTFKEPKLSSHYSPEYWCGWVLAEYQWYTAHTFESIFKNIPFDELLLMYPKYHEMDIMRVIEALENKYYAKRNKEESKLKTIRETCGFSQSELAKESGVNLRSIQMYEQKINDIDKAQANTVYKLAHTLHCRVEDLLEEPMK